MEVNNFLITKNDYDKLRDTQIKFDNVMRYLSTKAIEHAEFIAKRGYSNSAEDAMDFKLDVVEFDLVCGTLLEMQVRQAHKNFVCLKNKEKESRAMDSVSRAE